MGEKRKGHRKSCASTAVFWETARTWEKSTWKIAFSSLILPWVGWMRASSRAKVAFLWVAWYCAWAEIPFLWLVCGQHFAEQGHVAVYVKERWVVADNYRWIYWDFLLRVSSYMVADARNLKTVLSGHLCCLEWKLCLWKQVAGWVLCPPAEGQHLL